MCYILFWKRYSASLVIWTPTFMVDIGSVQISEFVEISETCRKVHNSYCDDASSKNRFLLQYWLAHGNKHRFSPIFNRFCFHVGCQSILWELLKFVRWSPSVALYIGCICSYELANIQLLFSSEYLFGSQRCFDDWKAPFCKILQSHNHVAFVNMGMACEILRLDNWGVG